MTTVITTEQTMAILNGLRTKLRFPYKGQATIEQLFDLGVTELDEIYQQIDAEMVNKRGRSLLNKKSKEEIKNTMRLNILEYVITMLQTEAEEKANLLVKASKKQEALEILDSKKNDDLRAMSVEQLEAYIASL